MYVDIAVYHWCVEIGSCASTARGEYNSDIAIDTYVMVCTYYIKLLLFADITARAII